MIYTLTLNPSVDYIVELPLLQLGSLNRTKSEVKFPGGKGINVSRVLKRNNVDSIALGFTGGFTGSYIEDYLNDEGISTQFIRVKGDTRINIKLKVDSETEINANGPNINGCDITDLLDRIAMLTSCDILVLAGSVPSTIPSDIYERIVSICHKNKVDFIVDAEERLLKTILSYQPFLIKPNHHELGDFFGASVSNVDDAILYGRKLIDLGAKNVIVSLAEKGAVFLNRDSTFVASVPKGDVKSSVGAGDSMVAGFLSVYQNTHSYIDAFQYSVAAGSATALSIGLCSIDKIKEMLKQVDIRKI